MSRTKIQPIQLNNMDYDLIARSTALGVAGDTITCTSIPSRKYLRVLIAVISTGAASINMRFNNDSAASYSQSGFYVNGASPAVYAPTSQTALEVAGSGTNALFHAVIDITNISGFSKLYSAQTTIDQGAASVAPTIYLTNGKYVSNTILSRIDLINSGAGDFTTASEFLVFGRD